MPEGADMGLPLEMLEAELLRLDAAERSRLLDKLLASFGRDEELDLAWDRVAAEREATAQESDWLDADAVLQDLRKSLKA
jgi:hypothetical protein